MTPAHENKATILIVEDTLEDRNAIAKALKNMNYRPLTHRTGASAISALKESALKNEPIDLILLDIVFDDEKDFSLCQELKKIMDIPVLFLSKLRSRADRVKAIENGGDDYITKPKDLDDDALDELMIRIDLHLERNRLQRELKKSNQQLTKVNGIVKSFFSPVVFRTIEHFPERLRMQQRWFTVAFWDIRGFSRLCHEHQTQTARIAEFLQEFCDAAARIIDQHGGIVDKFMGDGVMAMFGIASHQSGIGSNHEMVLSECPPEPTSNKEVLAPFGAPDAVRAALELRDTFGRIAEHWGQRLKDNSNYTVFPVSLGCGIVTAHAIVGRLGTEYRDQFTALGADVNLCARMENKAGKDSFGSILISNSTRARVKDSFEVADAGKIADFRNIDREVPIFSVVREKFRPGSR